MPGVLKGIQIEIGTFLIHFLIKSHLILIQIWALLLSGGEWHVSHSESRLVFDITLLVFFDDHLYVLVVLIRITYWNNEFASDFELIYQILGNLLSASSDMDSIVRCMFSVSLPTIAADNDDLLVLELLVVGSG